MITFPNAKINLGLNIVEKRADGYHNLETVFYPIPLEDALEVTALSGNDDSGELTLQQSGIAIAGSAEDNLVAKAYRILERDGYSMPSIDIHLHKHIPSGAGMGGGSADAAFMLCLLNDMFSLNISTERLEQYAAELGADCAFFVRNVPVFAEGIGNVFTPIELSLKGYTLVVVKPDIFVSTKEAFSLVKPKRPALSLTEIIKRPVAEWRELMVNDFEGSVFSRHPEIGEVKNRLYEAGAVYAAMSGSGSSVYALFDTDGEVALPAFRKTTFVFSCVLK